MSGKYLQTCLCPFVESFKQCQCYCILELQVIGLVVKGVSVTGLVDAEVAVGIETVGRTIGLVDALVGVQFCRVDDAGNGNEYLLHGGIDGFLL